jgi:hypothetical protein
MCATPSSVGTARQLSEHCGNIVATHEVAYAIVHSQYARSKIYISNLLALTM